MPATAIIVAAGSGTRMGFDKLAAPLAGTPVLTRTVTAFLDSQKIDFIIVVGPSSRRDLLTAELSAGKKPIVFVAGGSTRAESVFCGISAVPENSALIAVHDGARPLISPAEIDRVVTHAEKSGGCALARRVTETMKRSDAAGICIGGVDRENLWIMETPQVFSAASLRSAYHKAITQGWQTTDEVSAAEREGMSVQFLESRLPNPKITVPADLALAAALLFQSA